MAPREVFQKDPGHLLLHHGMVTKLCQRGRASSGVAIILGPALLRAWYMAGKPPPSHQLPTPTSQAGWLASPSTSRTARTKERTHTTRGARGGSISSSPRSTIRWIMRTRSGSSRNWQVFTTPFHGTQNSFPDKISTATSESGPRFPRHDRTLRYK